MSFWRNVFSESENEPSLSRVGTGFMILMAAVWITRIVWITNAIPDLQGVVFLICSLYAINKAPDIANAVRGKHKD